MIRKEIIKQYVASLNEDGELDYIFPLLLERMGFRILSTPKNSKGQSQYGRDVVAIKKVKGENVLYLFELKGFVAKDITDRTLNEKDGLIESLRASKYTPFKDVSIAGLKDCKRQYVFVHNGAVDANAQPTLDGFIKAEFPNGNFDRWDLARLTDYFSDYLFDETLLADEKSYRLFKKVLVLLDAEGNDFSDIVSLVDLQIARIRQGKKGNRRQIVNLFATLRLIASMVYFYAKDADNLVPAKFCIDTIVLKAWAWILREMNERKPKIVGLFNGLVLLQIQIYEEYVNKIVRLSFFPRSLFSYQPTQTERIFYPLRCYDALADLIFFYQMTEAYSKMSEKIFRNRLNVLESVIKNNPACTVPLLDTHSIPILMVFRWMAFRNQNADDERCMCDFVVHSIFNLIARYNEQGMWPEMSGNRMALARSMFEKSDDYNCKSSLLLLNFFELIAYMGADELYVALRKLVEKSEVNLQVCYPLQDEFDIEQALFEHKLSKEVYVDTSIALPEMLDDFKKSFKKKYRSIKYRTDAAGYGFLRTLAHKYYETDLFPDYLGREFCVE